MRTRGDNRARARLRSATAEDHARVDAAYGRFDLGSRDDYARFLVAQARAYLPAEAALERADIPRLLADWAGRRRSGQLRQDLAELGISGIDAEPFPPLTSEAQALGAAYVLEGSRLGGRLLARGVPEQFPRRFITSGSSSLWGDFLAVLGRVLTSSAAVDEAVGAARCVFARFEASALQEAEEGY